MALVADEQLQPDATAASVLQSERDYGQYATGLAAEDSSPSLRFDQTKIFVETVREDNLISLAFCTLALPLLVIHK